VCDRPRRLQHISSHHQHIVVVIAGAAFAQLRLLPERGRRTCKAPTFRDQVRQNGRLQTRLLSVRERHFEQQLVREGARTTRNKN